LAELRGGNAAVLLLPLHLDSVLHGDPPVCSAQHDDRDLVKTHAPTFFIVSVFNPYLNYHRPCAQADVTFDLGSAGSLGNPEQGRAAISKVRLASMYPFFVNFLLALLQMSGVNQRPSGLRWTRAHRS